MFTVHLRVNDKGTNRPTAVRLRLVDGQGRYRAPLGRLTEFATGSGEDVGGQVLLAGQAHAYIDGSCEVTLPAGKITVHLSKGLEYVPLTQEISLAAGQISLRLTIERWIDWRSEGWYAGDMRVLDISPHAAVLEGAAEGLEVVQLLARERLADGIRPASLTNLLAFSGSRELVRSGECLVAVNTLNEHPVLGRLALLHCHRPVFPLRTGHGGEHWSIADWCDQCHRKTGLVVWPDLQRWSAQCPQGEALAALVLGKIDAYEIAATNADILAEMERYHRLLDAGMRPALVGSSGKESNAMAMGAVRTYAQLSAGQTLDAATWIEAVRARRTVVSSGPLLSLRVAGQGPGSALRLDPGQSVPIRVEADSSSPLDRVELLAGGKVIDQTTSSLETDFRPTESTWIAARCFSRGAAWAHTSPIWLEVPGRPARVPAAALEPLLAILSRSEHWLHTACDGSDRQRGHIAEGIQQARILLLSRRSDAGETSVS